MQVWFLPGSGSAAEVRWFCFATVSPRRRNNLRPDGEFSANLQLNWSLRIPPKNRLQFFQDLAVRAS
jgi:hypothetical protein